MDSSCKYETEIGSGKADGLWGSVVEVPITLGVIDAYIGYNTLITWRGEVMFLKWHRNLDEAVEYAVRKAKYFRENGAPVFKEIHIKEPISKDALEYMSEKLLKKQIYTPGKFRRYAEFNGLDDQEKK